MSYVSAHGQCQRQTDLFDARAGISLTQGITDAPKGTQCDDLLQRCGSHGISEKLIQ